MVIFHIYVSLPKGKTYILADENFHGQISSIKNKKNTKQTAGNNFHLQIILFRRF